MTTTLTTGADRGIGRETARQPAAAGHTGYVGARFGQLDVTDDASAAASARIDADGELGR